MTNDEFVINLISVEPKRLPHSGGFVFSYKKTPIIFKAYNKTQPTLGKMDYAFSILGDDFVISNETYQMAYNYYKNTNLDRLKLKLTKDLRKEKLKKIENDL